MKCRSSPIGRFPIFVIQDLIGDYPRDIRRPPSSLRGAVRRSNRQPSTMQDDSRRLLRSARNDAVRMRRGESPIKSRMTVNDRPQLTVCSRTYRPAKQRSEEHTSELQSLMRISYAVFCLPKQIKQL